MERKDAECFNSTERLSIPTFQDIKWILSCSNRSVKIVCCNSVHSSWRWGSFKQTHCTACQANKEASGLNRKFVFFMFGETVTFHLQCKHTHTNRYRPAPGWASCWASAVCQSAERLARAVRWWGRLCTLPPHTTLWSMKRWAEAELEKAAAGPQFGVLLAFFLLFNKYTPQAVFQLHL